MLIRFAMHQGQIDLLPIYERLNACEDRAKARAIKWLLCLDPGSGFPRWFRALPRRGFESRRSKAIRFTILDKTADPTSGRLFEQLEHMSADEKYEFMVGALRNIAQVEASKQLTSQTGALANATPVQAPVQAPIASTAAAPVQPDVAIASGAVAEQSRATNTLSAPDQLTTHESASGPRKKVGFTVSTNLIDGLM